MYFYSLVFYLIRNSKWIKRNNTILYTEFYFVININILIFHVIILIIYKYLQTKSEYYSVY